MQYPLNLDGTIAREDAGAVDFECGLEEREVGPFRELEAILREVKRRGSSADRLGAFVLRYVEQGKREEARALLKAYRDDADLDDAEATSRAQDFTDGGRPVDRYGDPVEREEADLGPDLGGSPMTDR